MVPEMISKHIALNLIGTIENQTLCKWKSQKIN